VCSETGETPNATVTVKVGDKEFSADSEGSGAVDAGLKAICL
jgi:2-isopropylmalate synthase